MDNESNESDRELDIGTSQTKKPNNRNRFVHKNLVVSSQFPGGNIKSASFQQQFRMEGKIALVIQFWGNTDAQSDPLDKSWFYFSVSGIKDISAMNYQQIIFKFKNANNLRKFIREKRFKPYILMREGAENLQKQWQSIFISKMNILQNQIIEAEFVYTIKPGIDFAQFAENLPYTLHNVIKMHESLSTDNQSAAIYYHREIATYSNDDHPIYMYTITSTKNIQSLNSRQQEVWPTCDERPLLLKNRPEIVITSRVHPSETSSSVCVEGIIQSLIKNNQFSFLTQIFIFRIFPMLNPDGVENGHYRLDNYLQNLNRFYGHSDLNKTPSIFVIEKLLIHLRQKLRLFLFVDIHGHNSPKPSFIFGNFSQNFYQIVENKSFVKVMEILNEGNFDSLGCEFSRKNMTIKQKYDEHSKQASARVFAYRGNSQEENNQTESKTNTTFVQHSYTLQIHPYVVGEQIRKSCLKKQNKEGSNSFRNLPRLNSLTNKNSNGQIFEYEIIETYKKIGQNFLVSIMQILGINTIAKLDQSEDCENIRKRLGKQLCKQIEFYDRYKKIKYKQINREILQRYYQKLGILEQYKLYYSSLSTSQPVRNRLKQCPIQLIYLESVKKEKNQELLNKKLKLSSKIYFKNVEPSELEQKEKNMEKACQQDVQQTKKSEPIDFEKKQKLVKAKQFQMKEIGETKMGKKEIQSNPVSSKKIPHSEVEAIQKRIKKLMFRHRTQIEIPDEEYQIFKINALQSEQLEEEDQRNRKRHAGSSTSHQIQKVKTISANQNKLEPIFKQKRKFNYLKTEQNKHRPQFNDKIISQHIERGSNSESKKYETIEGGNPRIEEFVKKLSAHKLQSEFINQINKNSKFNVSVPIENKNPSISRNSYQNLKQIQRVMGLPENNSIVFHNEQMILKRQQQISNSLIKGRAAGTNKSLCTKFHNVEVIAKNSQKEVHDIVKSFRVLAAETSSRQEFIQKAKRIMNDKKRQYKTLEECLPIITEYDPTLVSKHLRNKFQQDR